jgi:hypothetical protein
MVSLKQAGSGLSNNQLKEVLSVFKQAGVKVPSMNSYYEERRLLCDDIFECVCLELDHSKEKYVLDLSDTWVVRVSDIDRLLAKIYNSSGDVETGRLNFKLGLDYGRGFTKLLLSLQNESSVYYLVYLWVAQVPENSTNFATIFCDSPIAKLTSNYNVSMTVDLKAALLCGGIMQGRYPCIWCTWDKRQGLSEATSTPRSSVQHSKMYSKLMDTYGGDAKQHAIDCCGVESAVAFPTVLVDYMQMFNPPKLHLLLGIAQRLYDFVTSTMTEDELLRHNELLHLSSIRRSSYHGGAFEGNASRTLLKKCDSLGFPPNHSGLTALRRFNAVVESCFGLTTLGDFRLVIAEFEESWKMTGLPCTPKVHAVCRHVPDFLDDFAETGSGLGAFSEQGFESAHRRFGQLWSRSYEVSVQSESYPTSLFHAVCDVNFVNHCCRIEKV